MRGRDPGGSSDVLVRGLADRAQSAHKEARDEISLIKWYVAKIMQQGDRPRLQVHGGLGMTDDTILAYFYRHERAARIYDGVDEVHKVTVARRILREYEGKTIR